MTSKNKNKNKKSKKTMTSLAEELRETTAEEEAKEQATRNAEAEDELNAMLSKMAGITEEAQEEKKTESMNEFVTALEQVKDFLKAANEVEEKAQLVIYLCASALGRKVSISFEKGLRSKVAKIPFLKDTNRAPAIAAAIGATILSCEEDSMPVQLLALKKKWMTVNGKYLCVFSSNRIKDEDMKHDVIAAMVDASTYLREEEKCELSRIISSQVPRLAFTERSRLFKRVAVPAREMFRILLRYSPKGIADFRKAAWEKCTTYGAYLLKGMVALVVLYALFARMRGRGFLEVLANVSLCILRQMFFFLFGKGSRGVFIFMITILASSISLFFFPELLFGSPEEVKEEARKILVAIALAQKDDPGIPVPTTISVPPVPAIASVARDAGSTASASLFSASSARRDASRVRQAASRSDEPNWRSRQVRSRRATPGDGDGARGVSLSRDI